MPKFSDQREDDIQKALLAKEANPNVPFKILASQYDVPYHSLLRRSKGTTSQKDRGAPHGRLSKAQETAVCRYIERLEYLRLAVRREFVRDAANHILFSTTPSGQDPPPPLGRQWVKRFIDRYEYSVKSQAVIDADRQYAEDLEAITIYFDKLLDIITEFGIVPEDIWNFDETGFRIGAGKKQFCVVRGRKRKHYLAHPINRESATAIEAISAGGEYIPLFLILTGKVHMSNWYRIPELEDSTVLAVTETGYSSDELSLQWIQHFHRHSQNKRRGQYILLLMDNHGSHHTREFLQFCDDHKIIPFGLPPHSTHLLQPLDVVVFQPLKHYHAKAIDILVRDGLTNISKIEFLAMIQSIRRQAFKESTIRSAFKKTGYVPWRPLVLDPISQRVERPITPPRYNDGSSPFGTPLTIRKLERVGNRINEALEAYEDVLDPELSAGVSRLIYGAQVQATELLQVRRDLSRTRLAEQAKRLRRSEKNRQIQHGGVLTVAEGRAMVQKKEINDIRKAEALIKARDDRHHKQLTNWFRAAAKEGRRRKTKKYRKHLQDLSKCFRLAALEAHKWQLRRDIDE